MGMGDLLMKDIPNPTRIVMDVLLFVRANKKYSSYRLDAVAKSLLDISKIDLDIYDMCKNFESGTVEGMHEILGYCRRDCLLPLDISDAMGMVSRSGEMASITMTPIHKLMTRGQKFKAESLLAKTSHDMGFIMNPPQKPPPPLEFSFDGATVIPPWITTYHIPVWTLDFASLYPSIMMSHLLCMSNFVTPENHDSVRKAMKEGLSVTEYQVNDKTVNMFVNSEDGVCPRLLQSLIAQRKKAKALMKEYEDAGKTFEAMVQNCRQLALKVTCNSVYGFAAAEGRYRCHEISQTVTYIGRTMIKRLIKMAEEEFGCCVVYGDTDSIFVVHQSLRNTLEDRTKAFELGKRMAARGTEIFQESLSTSVIKLEFEKVVCPMTLIAKKRYIGLKYEKDPNAEPELVVSGVEAVRRDGIAVAREIQMDIIRHLMHEEYDAALNLVRDKLQEIIDDKLPTKSYESSREFKDIVTEDVVHKFVARKVAERDPGRAYVTSDRIPFLMVWKPNWDATDAKIFNLAEDPLYVEENNIPLNRPYYILRQIKNPITRIMELFFDNIEVLFHQAAAICTNQLLHQKHLGVGDANRLVIDSRIVRTRKRKLTIDDSTAPDLKRMFAPKTVNTLSTDKDGNMVMVAVEGSRVEAPKGGAKKRRSNKKDVQKKNAASTSACAKLF